MTTSIDVVIPVRDNFALTDSCLRHLQAQTVPHRVIVVDNGSTDGTAELLCQHWPAAHVERFDHCLSFAAACNRGAAIGSGEIIVLLNNDVDCRPDFLERLTAPFRSDPSVAAVAALMLQPGEERIDSVGLCADVTLAGFPRMAGLPLARASDRRPLLAGPAGAAAGYRRIAWLAVGGLDEGISAYLEDFELSLRLRGGGWQTVAAPDAVGVHLGSATYGRRSASQRRLFGFARGYMLRRYRVLRGRHAVRTLATETVVVLADSLMSRDFSAASGRVAGWRAARRLPLRPRPPIDVVDTSIGFSDSLVLRRAAYGRRAQ